MTSTATEVCDDVVLVHSEERAIINAPVDQVDVFEWLSTLPDDEYQRCAPPDHLAGGWSSTDDGRPMSINVEVVGGILVVQHYVAEVHDARHCHMVSLSDLQTPAGWTTAQVIWDLSVTAIDANTCQYTNQVVVNPTRAFLDALEVVGQSVEQTAADLQAAVSDHNRRETPLYAASIERKALGPR
ncbi:hypothetical protein CIW49_25930 [Mycolicibacterium sp. P1-18]|nr:hypothetical protein CIW49_25930 [Mycolicibacterium sp. P1-18]